MFVVSRLNIGYSAEQDRLRLVCDCAAGERRVLWLTRRFVRRLLGALTTIAAPEAGGFPIGRTQRPAGGSVAPVTHQTAPAAPVDPSRTAPTGRGNRVVTRLRLRVLQAGVSLEFMDASDAVVQLDLDRPGLQCWLELLAVSCRAADWSLMGGESGNPVPVAEAAASSRVLH